MLSLNTVKQESFTVSLSNNVNSYTLLLMAIKKKQNLWKVKNNFQYLTLYKCLFSLAFGFYFILTDFIIYVLFYFIYF